MKAYNQNKSLVVESSQILLVKFEYKVTKKLIAFKIKICSRHPNPTN